MKDHPVTRSGYLPEIVACSDGRCIIHETTWYDDTYEKVDNLWRFRSRIVTLFTPPSIDGLVKDG